MRLNASKLKPYTAVREEVQCYLEHRYDEEPAPMDIKAVGEGGKSSNKNGKSAKIVNDQVCQKCSKNGHEAGLLGAG